MIHQLSLFNEILNVYSHSNEPVLNKVLYTKIVQKLSMPESVLLDKQPASKSTLSYNIFKRKIRWFQQTLKHAGVLNKVEGERGRVSPGKVIDARKNTT